MTKEEIFKIKEHIEIHARREPYAIKITEIMWKAVAELEHIEDLEKENAELKEQINGLCSLKDEELMCLETEFNTYKSETKELLNMFLRLHYNPIVDEHTLFCKVEQFLNSEVEK